MPGGLEALAGWNGPACQHVALDTIALEPNSGTIQGLAGLVARVNRSRIADQAG